MKVAISSTGDSLEADVDPRFGRAKYFLICDTETGEFKAVDNAQNYNSSQGAGIQSAESVSSCSVKCVLTGNCGPNAFRVLSAAGISVIIGVSGSVADALEKVKSGQLKPADSANVEGHWT